ncbi:MAG: hypothetical protein QOE20_106 [Mycobacterium sp.]|nr:hypothetical protein [Mycobacterium sp.]
MQRKADGSTAPAPPLSTDGTAVFNGKTITAIQLLSALIMYGRIPGVGAPSWIGPVHVWSGRLAVLVSVPVAVHCLLRSDSSPQIAGCSFTRSWAASSTAYS